MTRQETFVLGSYCASGDDWRDTLKYQDPFKDIFMWTFMETLRYETDSFIFMHFSDNKNEPDMMDENYE